MRNLLFADTSFANASLLNNFEIVATTIIALLIFKEMISKRLWIAIFLVTLSSTILSFEDMSSLHFSWGSLIVILAAVCWGLENNCTRMISSKNTCEIVMLKGIFSGFGSMVIAFIIGEAMPQIMYWSITLLLGFVAYGLSIFFYIMAQNVLGAARTSAYYAIAPFAGVLLSEIFLHEQITINYLIALVIMLIGSAIIVIDTLIISHEHTHSHTFTHTHDGTTHSHTIAHSHIHNHIGNEKTFVVFNRGMRNTAVHRWGIHLSGLGPPGWKLETYVRIKAPGIILCKSDMISI